jgi:putative ABC transport system permease protein
LERFKEIGALRAVGWTASNVMLMVLLESIFIGVLGGLLGIGLGFIASFGLHLAGLTAKVTLELVLQAFVFALVLGLAGGIYPAYRASKMDPIQALREE